MPYGLYISAEGAYAQTKRLETLSNNLANVDTTGFKRDLAIFQSRYSEQQGLDSAPVPESLSQLSGGVFYRESKTDFSPGVLKHTGIPTDMAPGDNAFFEIQRPDGNYLTRAGNFMLNGSGRLVTQNNDPVLDEGGSPIEIDPAQGPWTLMPDGAIAQGDTRQLLALVRPNSLSDLAKAGDNLFRPLAQTQPVPDAERLVHPGTLEQSDVRPTSEMMELIEASRAFEANINMIKNHDQMATALTERLLMTSS